jgi:hypothetical protein
MSDDCLPIISIQEQNGFQSALFLDLHNYDPKIQSNKACETPDTFRLSIESFSNMTPKDCSFKFCLSKDLLEKLEENTPKKAFNCNSDLKFEDIFLSEEEAEETQSNFQAPIFSSPTIQKVRKILNENNLEGESIYKLAALSNENRSALQAGKIYNFNYKLPTVSSQFSNPYQNMNNINNKKFNNKVKSGWVCLLCKNFNYESKIKF